MNKAKQAFIDKLHTKSKQQLIDLLVDIFEDNFQLTRENHYLHSLAYSQQQTLHFALNNTKPEFVFEISKEEKEKKEKAPKRDFSYA